MRRYLFMLLAMGCAAVLPGCTPENLAAFEERAEDLGVLRALLGVPMPPDLGGVWRITVTDDDGNVTLQAKLYIWGDEPVSGQLGSVLEGIGFPTNSFTGAVPDAPLILVEDKGALFDKKHDFWVAGMLAKGGFVHTFLGADRFILGAGTGGIMGPVDVNSEGRFTLSDMELFLPGLCIGLDAGLPGFIPMYCSFDECWPDTANRTALHASAERTEEALPGFIGMVEQMDIGEFLGLEETAP